MSAELVIRPVRPADATRLLDMMRAFYAGERLTFDEARARRMFDELTDPNPHGCLRILEVAGDVAGYFLASWGYSAEHGGVFLLMDELFVEPRQRGRGWGSLALSVAADLARARGAAVLKLEVSDHNPDAARLYLRQGFTDEKRRVLARRCT